MAKAKKSKAKKPAAKKPTAKKKAKKVKKTAKRAAVKSRRAPAKKSKRAAPKKKKQIVGEGDYAASRTFLKDQSDFVKKNKAKIPEMGREAERAQDGPEGDSLRAAEQEAMNRSIID